MGHWEAVIVVGGAVVVIVGIAEEVGRTGSMAEAEEVGVGVGVVVVVDGGDVDDLWDEEAVAVESTDVTAVKVEIDVTGSVLEEDGDTGGMIGAGAPVVEGGLLEVGEAVTTGWIVVITVELATQPMLAHV